VGSPHISSTRDVDMRPSMPAAFTGLRPSTLMRHLPVFQPPPASGATPSAAPKPALTMPVGFVPTGSGFGSAR
jgi:hypothetical protein